MTFLFHLLRDFYIVHDSFLVFCAFVLQYDFGTSHEHIDVFCFSFLPKDFGTFCKILFNPFPCFFDNIQSTFLRIKKAIMKKYLTIFL